MIYWVVGSVCVLLMAVSVAFLLSIIRKVGDVHDIVNQQKTDMLNFQRALIRALEDAGIPVPIDQSIQPE